MPSGDPANRCQACVTKVGAVLKSVVGRVLRPHEQVNRCMAAAVVVSARACGASPKTTPTCTPKVAWHSANDDCTAYSLATLQEHELRLQYQAFCLDCPAKVSDIR
jgi:hypothetical protein